MGNTTGGLSVARELALEASAEAVWALIGDFNGWNHWHPAIQTSDLIEGVNNQPGAVRRLGLGGDATIVERITRYSATDRSCTYIILTSVLPLSSYESTIRVDSTDDGKARISWKGTFDADGVSDAEAIKVVEGVYEGGFEALQKHFAG